MAGSELLLEEEGQICYIVYIVCVQTDGEVGYVMFLIWRLQHISDGLYFSGMLSQEWRENKTFKCLYNSSKSSRIEIYVSIKVPFKSEIVAVPDAPDLKLKNTDPPPKKGS